MGAERVLSRMKRRGPFTVGRWRLPENTESRRSAERHLAPTAAPGGAARTRSSPGEGIRKLGHATVGSRAMSGLSGLSGLELFMFVWSGLEALFWP